MEMRELLGERAFDVAGVMDHKAERVRQSACHDTFDFGANENEGSFLCS